MTELWERSRETSWNHLSIIDSMRRPDGNAPVTADATAYRFPVFVMSGCAIGLTEHLACRLTCFLRADIRSQAAHQRHQRAPSLCRVGRSLGPLCRRTGKVARTNRQVRLSRRRHLLCYLRIRHSLEPLPLALRSADYPRFLLKRNVRLYPPYRRRSPSVFSRPTSFWYRFSRSRT